MHLKGMRENEELSPHTTFGVGGRARYFVEVSSPAELIEAVREARRAREPYRIIAGGSNVIPRDGLHEGLTIRCRTGEAKVEGYRIIAEAGMALMGFVTTAIEAGLSGLEALSGIPGTVGGAIIGNAGAYGQKVAGTLEMVEVYDPELDAKHTLLKDQCGFDYRDSAFKGDLAHLIILRATFLLAPAPREALAQKSREIIQMREEKYKPGVRCPGSFFKNLLVERLPSEVLASIPNLKDYFGKVPAWYFLNEVGARGMRHGGLEIADFHGNFIMNTGGATYEDVRILAAELKRRVRERFKVELEEEVRYIE